MFLDSTLPLQDLGAQIQCSENEFSHPLLSSTQLSSYPAIGATLLTNMNHDECTKDDLISRLFVSMFQFRLLVK